MATFNIKVRLDTTGIKSELRTVQSELTKVEQRTAQNTRRSATSINSATTALTKFAATARSRAGVAANALNGIIKRLEQIDRLVTRVNPRFQHLLNAGGSTGRGAAQLRDLSTAFSNLSRTAAASERRIAKLERQMTQARAASATTNENVRRLNANLQQMGRTAATGGARAERSLRRVQNRIERTNISASRLATTVRLLFGSFVGGLGVVAAGRALAGFEQSMSSVEAITKATAAEMRGLRDEAQRLGSITRFTAQQAGQGMVFLARSGLSANQALQAIEPTLRLAQAGAIDLARAAEISTNIMVAFGLQVSDLPRVIDVMADTATSANTDISQLGEAMKFVGPVARALNVDVETVSAAIAVLSNAGLQASLAGTGLRQVLLKLVRQTGPARKQLAAMGLTAADINVQVRGLIPVLETFRVRMITAGEAAQIFENRGGTAFLALISGLETLKVLEEQLREATGAARRMAAVMDDNLNGAFIRFASATQAVLLELGDAGLTSGLRGVMESLADVMRNLAANAEILLNVLQLLAGTALVRFALGLAKALTGLGQTNAAMRFFGAAVRGLARFLFSGVTAVAALISGILTFSDEIVTSRVQIEGYGEVVVTLADHFTAWAKRIEVVFDWLGRLFTRLKELASVTVPEFIAEQFGIGIGAAGRAALEPAVGPPRPQEEISGAEEAAAERQAAEIAQENIRLTEEFLEAQDKAVAASRMRAQAYGEEYGRIDQQIAQTIQSLVQETELLQLQGVERQRLARQRAAEAQAGLRLAEVSEQIAEARKQELIALEQGDEESARRFAAAQVDFRTRATLLSNELARNAAIREGNAVQRERNAIDLQYHRAMLTGTRLAEYEANLIANRLGLIGQERDELIEYITTRKEGIRLFREEQAQLRAITGPQERYEQAVAAVIRLYEAGTITFEQYTDRLEELREQLERTNPELQKYERAIKEIRNQSPSQSLGIINTGAFGESPLAPTEGAGFFSGFAEQLAQALEGLRSFEVEMGAIFGRIAVSLSDTIGTELSNILQGTVSIREGFRQIAHTVVTDLLTAIIKLGVQYALNAILGQKVANAGFAAQAAQAALLNQVYQPLAANVALASFGANAGPASAALTSVHALSKALSAVPGLREGGIVQGPGGQRDDRILARLSSGEFVMNARATSRNRDRLERMNRGEDDRSERPIVVNMRVETPNADSFRRNEQQVARDVFRGLRIAEARAI